MQCEMILVLAQTQRSRRSTRGAQKMIVIHYDSRMVDGLRLMQRLYELYEIGLSQEPQSGDVLEIMLEREKA